MRKDRLIEGEISYERIELGRAYIHKYTHSLTGIGCGVLVTKLGCTTEFDIASKRKALQELKDLIVG